MLTRREFVAGTGMMVAGAREMLAESVTDVDRERMRGIAAFTAKTMETAHPVPFGAEIFDMRTGERWTRAVNAVGVLHDPSAHAETLTMRLACEKLGHASLKGYTLYTTCEPCPMCMACALWAGLDRMVYGATIADANKVMAQIRVPAREIVARSDLHCVVDGPVEREVCVGLFTDPRMVKAMARWKKP
jgi:tRNA(Arg) A34 adenosine deaminase TadA